MSIFGIAFVDQGYTGEQAAQDAAAEGIQLEVVKLPETRKGFVLLPRRWVVERSFAWAGRFRRLARDYERVSTNLGWFPSSCLCHPDAQTICGVASRKCITPSRRDPVGLAIEEAFTTAAGVFFGRLAAGFAPWRRL